MLAFFLKKQLQKLFFVFFITCFVVVLSGCSFGPFQEKNQSNSLPTEPFSQEEIDDVLQEVGKLMHIPNEKKPLIASITDAEKLRSEQDFYRDVNNGDILIIFPQDARAVLYRPSEKILVNVGPIFVDNQ